MTYETNQKIKVAMKYNILFVLFLAFGCLLFLTQSALAQSNKATPDSSSSTSSSKPKGEEELYGGYKISSSVEIGVRGVDVTGNDNKYRSDFNYKPGVRVFDSSFLMEDTEKRGRFFDSLLLTTSGWGGDPSGSFRLNIEKTGTYRFDSNVRRVKYFNNLNNIARNMHTADTRHNFGDFDLTLFPENDNFRVRLGYSFNRKYGDSTFSTRGYSDEFIIPSAVDTNSDDFRAGVEGRLLGFNLSLMEGYRNFNERTTYFINGTNLGMDTAGTGRLDTFQRTYPINGRTNFTQFNVQRTFAKRVDFTGRLIYADSSTTYALNETQNGRDQSNNIVDMDQWTASGKTKRREIRGDLGLTVMVTNDFRISDSMSYNSYNINGGNDILESVFKRSASGGISSGFPQTINILSYRVPRFRRFVNTIEGDYQINNHFSFNIGYRYTKRNLFEQGFDTTYTAKTNPVSFTSATTLISAEEFQNQTNSLIAGFKAKPIKGWTIFGDIEHGTADNAFTRTANYDYTNFRIRTRYNFKDFAFNASVIVKNNANPTETEEVALIKYVADPNRSARFIADIKSRIYSGSVDWTPFSKLSFNGGYTFQHVTSEADIVVPISSTYYQGVSRYFMRDHYGFFDIFFNPVRRVTLFASYRISKDTGQGDLISTRPQDIITSYPYTLLSPEVRLSVRLTKSIDWNAGYQYYDYKERLQNALYSQATGYVLPPAQDYRAHLVYTSLRFYFGGSRDR